MKEEHFTTQRTARYYTLGELNHNTKTIWIVLHGYMQSARFFIKQFKELKNDTAFIVAPEALSRAYVNGVSGKVGASWMTKEERENEIADYIFYLNTLSKHILVNAPKSCAIRLLGFSQGVSALCRWYAQSEINAQQIILWCGTFPADMPLYKGQKQWKNVHLVSASNDSYISSEKTEEQKTLLTSLGINYTEHPFEGKHEIETELLRQIASY
ncbi:MAG: phospholipase [Flavobacteriales bacterium]|nr:phospholipase [Flavobacteriales bacterium]